jgi:hypothetical protein
MKTSVSRLTVAGKLTGRRSSRALWRSCAISMLSIATMAVFSMGASSASAAASGPAWAVKSFATPTNFSEGDNRYCVAEEGCDAYVVTVTNVGTGPTVGPVVIRDVLPSTGVVAMGLTALSKADNAEYEAINTEKTKLQHACGVQGGVFRCEYGGEVPPNALISLRVEVRVSPGAEGLLTNRVEVEGGGAPFAATSSTNSVNGARPGFGIQDFGTGALSADGQADVQAGGHPVTNTTSLNWTTCFDEGVGTNEDFYDSSIEEPRTQVVDLPPGFIGDAQALERCPLSQVPETEENRDKCPAGSLLGYITVEFGGGKVKPYPVYNVPPEAGYPAEFAFEFLGATVTLLPRLLPSTGGYVVSVSLPYVPRGGGGDDFEITGARIDLFGDPSERDGVGGGEAFLTNPQDCAGGLLRARLEMDSWVHPAEWVSAEATMFEASASQGVSGCGALRFEPSIGVRPETTETDTPSGYEVDLRVPQSTNIPGDLATPDLKEAVVSLPEGVSVDPSAANGLVACQETGPEGIDLGSRDQVDADRLASEGVRQEGEEAGPDGLVHPALGHCPAASQIGEVEVITPLLAEPLRGHVFVAAPECGGAGQAACTPRSAEDGELFGIYLEVVGSGAVVKLRGQASVNPRTGQVTTRFTETPQLPFSEVKLKLNGGPRAPLANPQSCGTANASSVLTPWSTPYTADATPGASFPVTGCSGNVFGPAFIAETTNPAAGAFSPFTLTFSRHDGEQDLSGVAVSMPGGLLGKIAGVGECGEGEVRAAEANTGGCPAVSQIGTATAGAGAGPYPFYQSGAVYLTGPYDGAPFGLAVVVAANAGPYHLGNIVVRAAIHIDPATAQVSVVSNPLPQMIDGVPLRVQTVNVTVGGERNFTFNPTSCVQKAVSGTLTSAQGVGVGVSSPFAAAGCAALPFKPVFSASTVGRASKAHGASLDTKVVFPTAPAGSSQASVDANTASVKVELPKQLPSRLTTLQKACLAATFEANPASCPVASNVGSVTASTPLLASPLAGPAYLVSHGGEEFPQLVMILQGEGVRINLVGSVLVRKGITSVTLKSVPDAPISSFELKTPTGPYSALTAYVPEKAQFNLCGQKLVMPTMITAQNGAVFKQSTKIAITGCPKTKTTTNKKKPAKASRRAK